jgi:FlaA1/EpsC-like NDP-sugar epimerase
MRKRVDAALHRALDIAVALGGLVLLSLVLPLIALLVKFGSSGPVFYRARRVGKDGGEFGLFKFRTMVHDADQRGPSLTLAEDPRVTPSGRWLRAHRLDEIPQLWNVLKGEMSLVGPRPEAPRYAAHYTPEQRRVLEARPGITGPVQIAFRNEGERLVGAIDPEHTYLFEIMPAKLNMDLAYLERRTFLSDLAILLRTLRIYLGERILAISDLISFALAYVLAFAIRFDNTTYSIAEQLGLYWLVLFPIVVIKLIVFERMGLYRRLWRYASVKELLSIVAAVVFSSTLIAIFILTLWVWPWGPTFVTGFPRSIIAIDAMLTLLLAGGVRFFMRWRHETNSTAAQATAHPSPSVRRVLVAGAGDAGAMTVREMQRNPQLGYLPLGFVDDDPDKQGLSIYGVPVVGTLGDLPGCARRLSVSEVFIAIPTAPGSAMRRVFNLAQEAGVRVRTLPGYYELIGGQVSVGRAREVRLEDLLRRAPVSMDLEGVAAYLTGKVILITGAGGSIGSEVCRQIARFGPARLLLLGHGEDSLHQILMELQRNFPGLDCLPVIGTVRDRAKLDSVIVSYRPHVIFHAAAYKHVPLMERNEDEAVLNNVLGTRRLVAAAQTNRVPCLVFISSDKAVEPNSVMGMTKRMGEWIVQHAARQGGQAYVAVRFGNVLGSRGSVVPLFQEQITTGGPITVTHPQVTRYFMTIPEAVRLVLQAGAVGKGGEVFVLDMGEPMRIYDLACDLIRLNGMEPERDIPIVFTGLRPGEKLHEALYSEAEDVRPAAHSGIWVAAGEPPVSAGELEILLDELEQLARERRQSELRELLAQVTGDHQVEKIEVA